jgi:hypothetical protein
MKYNYHHYSCSTRLPHHTVSYSITSYHTVSYHIIDVSVIQNSILNIGCSSCYCIIYSYTCIYTYLNLYSISIPTCTYTSTYTCIYTYTYTYTCTYTCTYIPIPIPTCMVPTCTWSFNIIFSIFKYSLTVDM